jgi:hypothetical protein
MNRTTSARTSSDFRFPVHDKVKMFELLAEKCGDVRAGLERWTRGRNPWERGTIARLSEVVTCHLEAWLDFGYQVLERHRTSISWAFCCVMLAGTTATSALITLPLLRTALDQPEPPRVKKRPVDPLQIQKQLEAAILQADFPLARQKLEILRTVWAGDAKLHQAEGALLMVEGENFSAAREQFLAALALRPGDPELLFNLAEAEFALGNYETADAVYRRLKADQLRGELIRFRRFLCARMQGHIQKAALVKENASVSFQSPAWFYIEAAEAHWHGEAARVSKLVDTARLMHGDKTKIFDRTLVRLGIAP